MANDELTAEDEPDLPELKRDRGHIGFVVLILVLIITSVALLAGIMIYRQRYNACAFNNFVYCPDYVCADGSNPIEEARVAVQNTLTATGAGTLYVPLGDESF